MKSPTTLFLSTLALAAAAVLASPAALARQGEYRESPQTQPFVSTLSRAEVAAEAARALRAGEIQTREFGQARNEFLAKPVLGKSRAQVLAELTEARRQGLNERWDENGLAVVNDALRRGSADTGARLAGIPGATAN